MKHDWDNSTAELRCCKRCGAVAELNDAYDGYRISRPECINASNVVGMTFRRMAQLRKEVADRAARMQIPSDTA